MTVIPLDEIAIFNKDDLVILVSRNGHKYVVDYSLEELMQLLPDNNFYKINRQTILNINVIKEVVQEGKNMIVALNSETKFDTLKVSQRNIASIKNWLEQPREIFRKSYIDHNKLYHGTNSRCFPFYLILL